jgi:hypothetical protein
MEVWIEEQKPEVISTTNIVLALVLHLAFFLISHHIAIELAKINFPTNREFNVVLTPSSGTQNTSFLISSLCK